MPEARHFLTAATSFALAALFNAKAYMYHMREVSVESNQDGNHAMSARPRRQQYGKKSSEVFVGGMAIMIIKQFLHIIRRLIIEFATSRILRQIQLESFANVGVRASLRDIAASNMLPKKWSQQDLPLQDCQLSSLCPEER